MRQIKVRSLQHLIYFLTLILLSSLATATTPVANKYPLTDFSKPVFAKATAQLITINLPTNRSTGYQWYLLQYDDKLLEPTAYHYIPAQMSVPGAPGVSSWQFQLKKTAFQVPRVTHIEFEYRRSWEALSGNRQSLTIITSPSGS